MNIIRDLRINDSSYSVLDNGNILNDLSKVNIFVGKNNTGKSRFLRSIFYKNDSKLEFIPPDEKFEYYLTQMHQLDFDLENHVKSPRTSQRSKLIYNRMKECISKDYCVESESPCNSIIELIKSNKDNSQRNEYIDILSRYFEDIDFLDDNLFKYDFHRIYIPSLRGLLPLVSERIINSGYGRSQSIYNYVSEDVFGNRTKNDYFGENANIIVDINDSENILENNINNSIITGHYFYRYVQEFLLGNLEQREIIKEYQEYLSENFFNNEEVALIPKLGDEVLTVKIGDEKERKIYNLGEGIQSIILITLPLFLYLDKSKEKNTNVLVFIEEPEVGLHPELQRKLLKTLLSSKFDNYQFFFTTHSNHFIDRIFENESISIYSFDKNLNQEDAITKFTIEKVGFDHLPTLKRLGVLPSSVLAQNSTILVEGSHDVTHYKFYLHLYQEKLKNEDSNFKKFKDGVHYSFLRGGGKEIVKTISEFNSIQQQRIFTVLDKDDDKDYQKNKKAFDKIGYKKYRILNVREVENLISKEILIKILKSIREIRKLDIDEDFKEEEYQKSNFYSFIKNVIIPGEKPSNFFNKDTFKDRFSYKEQEFTGSFDNLSKPAKEVTEEIYNFIKENNDTDLI